MENPGFGAGASETCLLGGDSPKHTAPLQDLQVLLDKAMRHEWPAEALGSLLALRLDPPQRWLLAIGGLMALGPDERETISEAVLVDLRAGPPLPAFDSIKAEAALWTSFASPAERKHYLIACWNALPKEDRTRFLRVAA